MFALLVALAVSAPATLNVGAGAERPSAPILDEVNAPAARPVLLAQGPVDPTAPDHTPTFVEQYLAFQSSPMASKQVNDGLVLSHVIGYLLPCGSLWGPVVATKDAQFSGDVVSACFVSGLMWTLIASGVTIVTIGIGSLTFLALPYLTTTSTLNAIDRDIKKRGLAEDRLGNPIGAPPPPPPTSTTPAPAPQQGDTPPPSYAY